MREILFRGKYVCDGEWIYGYYAGPAGGRNNFYEIRDNSDSVGAWLDVDPATVGEFTGLKDKNGKRIFEGDIVHTKGGCVSGFGAVEFRNGSFGISDAKRKRFYFLDDHSVYRVDGNIHDNPELLKEDGK